MADPVPQWVYDRILGEREELAGAAEYQQGQADEATAIAADLRQKVADLDVLLGRIEVGPIIPPPVGESGG